MGDTAEKSDQTRKPSHHGPNGGHLQPVNGKSNNGRPTNADFIPSSESSEKDFAFTETRIQENYPFYGTLLKEEDGFYRRKEDITRKNAKDIDWVKENYSSGKFELRLKGKGGGEKKINFSIKDTSEPQPENRNQQPDSKTNISDDVAAIIRRNYEAVISSNEKIISNLQTELDQKSRKLREFQEGQNSEIRQLEQEHKKEVKELEKKIDELKEQLRDVKFDLKEKELDIKFSGQESTVEKLIDRVLSDEGLLKQFAPFVKQAMQQNSIPKAALNGATQQPRSNPQPHNSQPDNPQHETQNEEMNSQATASKKEIAQNVVNAIYAKGVEALKSDSPDQQQVINFVDQQIRTLQKHDMQPEPQLWINIAKSLITFVSENDIAHEKLADVVEPLLNNVGAAKNILRTVSPDQAASMLQATFDFSCDENERAILVNMLEIFKKRSSG